MKTDKEKLKDQLLKQYAAQLDEMFEKLDDSKAEHLTEIENIALKIRQQVGHNITEALAVADSRKQAVDAVCPKCKQAMHYKGRKPKWLKTRTGDMRVERPYYYCKRCRSGHFPPG